MASEVFSRRVLFNKITKELILANQHLSILPEVVIHHYGSQTEYLDISNNRIRTLSWTSAFKNLKYLILDNNGIRDNDLQNFQHPLPKVTLLSLNKNDLRNLAIVTRILNRIFPNLEYLSLHGNPTCPDGLISNDTSDISSQHYDLYRSQVMQSMKNLKFLDHSEIIRAININLPRRNVRRLTFSPKMIWAKLNWQSKLYHPLPYNKRYPGHHSGVIRKASPHDPIFTYIGKNSEGNRFISNRDL